MRLTTEELRMLYQERTARSRQGRADCLSEETMARLAAEEIDPVEREKIADHLMVCSDCVQEYRLLREVKSWAEQTAISAAEPAPVIQGQRGRIGHENLVAMVRASWRQRLADIFSPGAPGYALAGVFFVLSLGCVVWVISSQRKNAQIVAGLNEQLAERDRASLSLQETRRQLEETSRQLEQQKNEIADLRRSVEDLSQPQVNVPITDLELRDVPRGATSEIETVTVPAGANLFTLILHGGSERAFSDHALEVLDNRGQRIWRVQGLRRSPADTFNVALPRRLMPEGLYRLRLYGLRAGKSESIGDYLTRVRYQ